LGVGVTSRSTRERHEAIDLLVRRGKGGDETHERRVIRGNNAVRQGIRLPRVIARARGAKPRAQRSGI